MLTLKLAIRNLRRNLRRSLITGIAIALGLAYLLVGSGFGDGVHNQMIEAGVGSMAGHVVVQAPGWQERREADLLVPDAPHVIQALQDAFPRANVVPRIFLQGLLTSPDGSVGASVMGVDPAREARVNPLAEKVVEGTWLPEDARGALVLGKTLAETLEVGLGDKVVLMTQVGGEIESRLFRVRGIFSVGIEEVDGFVAHVPLADAQALLGVEGAVNQVALHLGSARDTPRATARVRQLLWDEPVEVLPWPRALPDLHQWVIIDDAGLYIFLAIIGVIVLLGITNTVLMGVLERMREFGVMLALGTSPRRLAALVLAEAAVLGAVAVAVGLAVGLLANWPLAEWGLDMERLVGESMEAAGVPMESHMYSDLSPRKVVLFAGLTFLATVLAAAWPAWKAARLRPVESLQHR